MAVHNSYLQAGANVIISSTYQMSYEGLATKGLNTDQANGLMRKSVELCIDAAHKNPLQLPFRPLVAASIGTYAAHLANGKYLVTLNAKFIH